LVPDTCEVKKEESFYFLGKGTGREENFDSPGVIVTTENVKELYRMYLVDKDAETGLYIVRPEKLYNNASYFNRILRFTGGKQVAARKFYGYHVVYVFENSNGYLLGLNSLSTTAGNNTSSFTCKTILLDKETLKVKKEREYRYPEQNDEYYAFS